MKVKNILICLDLSATDKTLVEYTLFFLSKLPGQKHLTLFHNIRYDFLGGALGVDPQGIATLKETIVRNIRTQHKALLNKSEMASYDIIVKDYNSTADAILTLKEELEIDLLVMGKKMPDEGAGIIPLKILSLDRQQTPVLLVEGGSALRLDSILTPIDLSKITYQIIETTNYLAKKESLQKKALYIYQLPMTYFPYFKTSDQEIENRLRLKANAKIKKFLSANELLPESTWDIEVEKAANISNGIIEFMHRNEIDLIVMGRIGRTNLLGNHLGGVTRRIIQFTFHRPVLIV